jgi:hypothetical protein
MTLAGNAWRSALTAELPSDAAPSAARPDAKATDTSIQAPEYAPGNPRDQSRVWVGNGPLGGRLLPASAANLPADYLYLPIADEAGNPWFLIVGQRRAGAWTWVTDWAQILKRFVFGNITGNKVVEERREHVDIPSVHLSPGNGGGDTGDNAARLVLERARLAAFEKMSIVVSAPEARSATYFDNPQMTVAPLGLLAPLAKVPYVSGGKSSDKNDRRPHWMNPLGYWNFYRDGKNPNLNKDADREFRVLAFDYYFEDFGVTTANVGELLSVPAVDPNRLGLICNIPARMMPIPPLDFDGRVYLLGCAWSRIAIVQDYNESFYPRSSFGAGLANAAAALDEARISEIIGGVFHIVGGIIQGILTYDFSGVEEGLTTSVRGAAWQKIGDLEASINNMVVGLQKISLGYDSKLIDAAQQSGKAQSPGGQSPVTQSSDGRTGIISDFVAFFRSLFGG